MPHMVMFRSNEGKPGYHQAEALEDAVRFVERLRNQENVTDARIFKMEEVPLEFRTYYKVEVGGSDDAAAPAPAAVPAPLPAKDELADMEVAEPVPVASSRFSLRGGKG
jgi:hypothetical protein